MNGQSEESQDLPTEALEELVQRRVAYGLEALEVLQTGSWMVTQEREARVI